MDWYKIDSQTLFDSLKTNQAGLSSFESESRLQKYGKNALPKSQRFKAWLFLLSQLKSPLIFILVLAGVITFFIKEYVDMSIIFTSVIVNLGIGFYQEYSSSKILEKLSKMIRVTARVKRDGQIREVDSELLVPGDVVILNPGMKVPADARLIRIKDLEVSEAMLTGESNSVSKNIDPIRKDSVLGDRKNMLFMGTTIERGEGEAIVVATGVNSEIGKIAELTKKAEEELTPLQERLEKLGKNISIIVVASALLIVLIGLYEGMPFIDIFITSVAVAVAAIPEGLPAALAVILAISSQRILNSGGLIKKLIAAESLGSTSVICLDKTGTLTEGTMQVEKIISKGDRKKFYSAMILANEALIEVTDGKMAIKGESTDKAKLENAFESGFSWDQINREFPRLGLVQFNSVNKYIASFHKTDSGKSILFVSGAPEIFIKPSAKIDDQEVRSMTEGDVGSIKKDYEDLASDGYRMIGLGYKELDVDYKEIQNNSMEQLSEYVDSLVFLGLAAIRDPIREDVRKIMSQVREAGLKLVMITGDHKLTAMAIGRDLGMLRGTQAVMEGSDLDKLSDQELEAKIRMIDIFARVDPVHKLRVVKAWKAVGESVAATGDGINDAPALKMADIGIAVNSGTDVTKESADLVLMNDSFTTIVEAIKQGRTAFYNIKKVAIFLLSNSFTELILILGALIFKIPLPITAVQILWTNLVEDGLPNFALAFEPSEEGVMKRKPINRKSSFLDTEGKILSYPLGIATDLVLFFIYFELLGRSHLSLEYIRTFIFAALGTDSLFYIFGLRSLDKSVFKINPFKNVYLIYAIGLGLILMIMAVYVPFFNDILKTEPLSLVHASIIVCLGVYKLFLVELVKWFYNRKRAI